MMESYRYFNDDPNEKNEWNPLGLDFSWRSVWCVGLSVFWLGLCRDPHSLACHDVMGVRGGPSNRVFFHPYLLLTHRLLDRVMESVHLSWLWWWNPILAH
ncbi:hypothetical protein EBZ35_06285 [bacterium]|nr:hypothetical protein [bacterium]